MIVDFLPLVDVNAGGLRLKKGQGILPPKISTKLWVAGYDLS